MTNQPHDLGTPDDLQVQALARWLAGELTDTPEALDVDVVETVYALRPDLAPAPRVQVDDILAAVTAGPLASMPVNASAAAPQPVPAASNRPWMLALLAGGGMTSLAAAAALLLTALTFNAVRSSSQPEAMVASEARDGASDAVVVADTGRPGKRAPARKPSASRPRQVRSRPSARPAPAPAPLPARPAIAHDLDRMNEAKKETQDAVAFADEDEFDEEAAAYGRLEAPRLIPELARSEPASEVEAEPAAEPPMVGGARADDDLYMEEATEAASSQAAPLDLASRGSGAPPPPSAPAKAKAAQATSNRADRTYASDAPSPALSRRARRGTDSASSPAIDAVRAALADGDPITAVATAQRALATPAADTAERQRLYALLGDAHLALGQPLQARIAYEEADAIRRRR